MQSILFGTRSQGDNRRLSDTWSILRRSVVLWHRRVRQRHSLSELDNRMLADIGLSPADRQTECNKSFWQA